MRLPPPFFADRDAATPRSSLLLLLLWSSTPLISNRPPGGPCPAIAAYFAAHPVQSTPLPYLGLRLPRKPPILCALLATALQGDHLDLERHQRVARLTHEFGERSGIRAAIDPLGRAIERRPLIEHVD